MTVAAKAAVVALAAQFVVFPARATPKEGSALLAEAEQAYRDVDFSTARDKATQGLEAGGATQKDTARLEEMLGIAEAALDHDDAAKRAFIAAIAADPSWKLDRGLSPKIRAPYLEALGYWDGQPDRIALDAKPEDSGKRIVVLVTDPAHLVTDVTVHVRSGGRTTPSSLPVGDGPLSFALPPDVPLRGFEYWVSGLDQHGNSLVEIGSDDDPRHFAATAGARSEQTSRLGFAKATQRSYLLPIALGAAGVAATAAGVAFHVEREQAAKEWNGPSCERPGSTRLAQCSDVDHRIRVDDALAITGYAVGGAFLAASVVTLLAGGGERPVPSDAARAARLSRCDIGLGAFDCTMQF